MRRSWLSKKESLAIHAMQLAWFGGAPGVRNDSLLDSALASPRMIANRPEDAPSISVLAAAYGAGIVRNRPFIDGNKRTGLVAAFTFIERNGFVVTAPPQDACRIFHDLAAGKLSEEEFARWLDINTKAVSK